MSKQVVNIGDTGAMLISKLANNFNMIIDSIPFTYNVRDYGAGNGIVDDATTIQSVIDIAAAVSTLTHGAKVLIPNGDYLIKSVLTLKTNISIIVDNNAYFYVESGYTGAIWQGGSLITKDCVLEGGRYFLNENTTFFKHEQANNGYFLSNRFSNIYIHQCKYVFDLSVVGNGWINANNFENITIWEAVKFMPNIPLGSDGNFFSNIMFQTWTDKTTGIVGNISGSHNQFINIMVWDFNVAVQGSYIIHLGETSHYNIITGGILEIGFEDLGTGNYVFSNGVKLTA